MNRAAAAACLALLAATVAAAEVDGCATALGSIGVELRYARQLPRDARTTFTCPRDTAVFVGMERQRILAALGPPDETQPGGDGEGVAWDFWFGPRPGGDRARPTRQPGLRFGFDDRFQVASVTCLSHP